MVCSPREKFRSISHFKKGISKASYIPAKNRRGGTADELWFAEGLIGGFAAGLAGSSDGVIGQARTS